MTPDYSMVKYINILNTSNIHKVVNTRGKERNRRGTVGSCSRRGASVRRTSNKNGENQKERNKHRQHSISIGRNQRTHHRKCHKKAIGAANESRTVAKNNLGSRHDSKTNKRIGDRGQSQKRLRDPTRKICAGVNQHEPSFFSKLCIFSIKNKLLRNHTLGGELS